MITPGFAVPRDRILAVSDVRLGFDASPHPWEVAERTAIAHNWAREIERNPALFDGKVLLFSSVWLDGDVLAGVAHEVGFSALMYWRKARPRARAGHAYAHALLVASDGPLVAVRMAGHTANAGQVYFAAGSFEPADVRGDRIDVVANMRREVLEETRIDLAQATGDPDWIVLALESGVVMARRYRLAMTGNAALARIRQAVAAEANPELADAVLLGAEDIARPDLAPQMQQLMRWHFSTEVR